MATNRDRQDGVNIPISSDPIQALKDKEIIHKLERLLSHIEVNSSAPTVNDDDQEGYEIGTIWVDTAGADGYVCIDNTRGAAVWKQITP